MNEPECKLEWVKNFYTLEQMESLSWGCYSPGGFPNREERNGVKGVFG